MCNRILDQIFSDNNNLTSTDKLILLAIGRFCRPGDNRCYRSLNDLAADTGFTRACVARTLKKLREKGILITVEHQHGFQTKSNVYAINLNKINDGKRSIPPSEQRIPPVEEKAPLGGILRLPHYIYNDYIYIYKQKSQENENSQAIQKDENLDAMFEEWWAAYPRKQNKAKTFDAFREALRKSDYKTLLKKAVAYAKFREKATENKPDQVFYTKMPHNWLAQCLWEDHYGVCEREEIPKDTTSNHQFKECSPYVPFKPTETERVKPTQESLDWMSRLMKASKFSDEEYFKVKKEYDDYFKQKQEAA